MKRDALFMIVGGGVTVFCLLWMAGTPSTPAEGYRSWMNVVGIISFCVAIPILVAGIVLGLRAARDKPREGG